MAKNSNRPKTMAAISAHRTPGGALAARTAKPGVQAKHHIQAMAGIHGPSSPMQQDAIYRAPWSLRSLAWTDFATTL